MLVVYKYPLPVQDRVRIDMPVGARILHVDVQNNAPCLWALVDGDPNPPMEARRFFIVGTGHPMPWASVSRPERAIHHGTVLMMSGNLVLHIFEMERYS